MFTFRRSSPSRAHALPAHGRFICCAFLILAVFGGTGIAAEDQGNVIEFSISSNGSTQLQSALVQHGMISVRQVGGDITRDMLFESASRTLYIINHQQKNYMKIDQQVIDQVDSMVKSLSAVVDSQKGVLSDLLGSFGLGGSDETGEINMKNTGKQLRVSGVQCVLHQAYRNDQLETEVCIAAPESLRILGDNYATLQTFYLFSDQLLNRAGQILSSLGVVIPTLKMEQGGGLPVLVHSVREKMKTSLNHISSQQLQIERFALPNGYTEAAIPFIS